MVAEVGGVVVAVGGGEVGGAGRGDGGEEVLDGSLGGAWRVVHATTYAGRILVERI